MCLPRRCQGSRYLCVSRRTPKGASGVPMVSPGEALRLQRRRSHRPVWEATQPRHGAHLGEGPEPWLPWWCSEERGTKRVLLHEACAGLVPNPPKIDPLRSRAQLWGFTGLSLPRSQGKSHVSTVRAWLPGSLGVGAGGGRGESLEKSLVP